jgi:hypothetical protein
MTHSFDSGEFDPLNNTPEPVVPGSMTDKELHALCDSGDALRHALADAISPDVITALLRATQSSVTAVSEDALKQLKKLQEESM